jgi:hypothetical protein
MSNFQDKVHPSQVDRQFPQPDREFFRQKALLRYRHIKSLKESERSLDDNLFLENFEAAMQSLWGFFY